jgi:PadR family transcriptional regulator PadR
MHGQQIAEEIAKRRGTKPTPGTIYPALKELTQRGLITGKKTGRRVTYTLTQRGNQGIDRACQYFCQAFQEIFEEYR